MSHEYEQRSFDRGAMFGLEVYCQERARVGTYGDPLLVGYLSACAGKSAFERGTLHGIALGAKLHHRAMMAS